MVMLDLTFGDLQTSNQGHIAVKQLSNGDIASELASHQYCQLQKSCREILAMCRTNLRRYDSYPPW